MGQEQDFVEKFWIWIPDTCGKAIDNILNQNYGLRKKKKIRLKWYINWTVRHIHNHNHIYRMSTHSHTHIQGVHIHNHINSCNMDLQEKVFI